MQYNYTIWKSLDGMYLLTIYSVIGNKSFSTKRLIQAIELVQTLGLHVRPEHKLCAV